MQKIGITYAEDSATLEWIDRTAAKVSTYRGGANVSRADVIRAMTRLAAVRMGDLSVRDLAGQI